jgi:hypothetical protein
MSNDPTTNGNGSDEKTPTAPRDMTAKVIVDPELEDLGRRPTLAQTEETPDGVKFPPPKVAERMAQTATIDTPKSSQSRPSWIKNLFMILGAMVLIALMYSTCNKVEQLTSKLDGKADKSELADKVSQKDFGDLTKIVEKVSKSDGEQTAALAELKSRVDKNDKDIADLANSKADKDVVKNALAAKADKLKTEQANRATDNYARGLEKKLNDLIADKDKGATPIPVADKQPVYNIIVRPKPVRVKVNEFVQKP